MVSEWECVFKEFLKNNPEINKELDSAPEVLHDPLNLRDSVYGGRLETFCVYYEVQPNECIRYLDFCSMYPFTMLTKVYCKGIRDRRKCIVCWISSEDKSTGNSMNKSYRKSFFQMTMKVLQTKELGVNKKQYVFLYNGTKKCIW